MFRTRTARRARIAVPSRAADPRPRLTRLPRQSRGSARGRAAVPTLPMSRLHVAKADLDASGHGVLGPRDPLVVVTQLRMRVDVICIPAEQGVVSSSHVAGQGIRRGRPIRHGSREVPIEIAGRDGRIDESARAARSHRRRGAIPSFRICRVVYDDHVRVHDRQLVTGVVGERSCHLILPTGHIPHLDRDHVWRVSALEQNATAPVICAALGDHVECAVASSGRT